MAYDDWAGLSQVRSMWAHLGLCFISRIVIVKDYIITFTICNKLSFLLLLLLIITFAVMATV